MIRLAVVFAALAIAQPLAAQAYQCRMPQLVDAPLASRDGPIREMPVTGYTLAVSWSPEFCKPRQDERSHALQCSGRNGSFGMVLHGLWPESGRSWPQWCPTRRQLNGKQVAAQLCTTPSARLVARQWAKHGACMTRRPETYLKVSNILWRSLRWPDFDSLSRREGLTAGQIRETILAANPGWRHRAIGLKVNERGWLEELRLCYDRRFRPTDCDKARFGPQDGARVKIWRGL